VYFCTFVGSELYVLGNLPVGLSFFLASLAGWTVEYFDLAEFWPWGIFTQSLVGAARERTELFAEEGGGCRALANGHCGLVLDDGCGCELAVLFSGYLQIPKIRHLTHILPT